MSAATSPHGGDVAGASPVSCDNNPLVDVAVEQKIGSQTDLLWVAG